MAAGLRIAFAEEQTAIFEQMRQEAATAPPGEAVAFLRYAVGYYPSGTKQVPGSGLDKVVERARRSAVREIIADLRRRTQKDYGDDAQAWLDALGEPDRHGPRVAPPATSQGAPARERPDQP
jgi:hypothetical protein